MANIIRSIRKSGANLPQRSSINLIPSGDVSITVVDDEANDEVEVTLTTSGSGTTVANVANLKHIVGRYSFATQGGAVSTITLTDVNGNGVAIAATDTIISISYRVITAFTSAGAATTALGTTGSTGSVVFENSGAISSSGWNAIKQTQISGAILDATTDFGNLSLTIGAAALTAGVVDVHVLVSPAIA